MTPSTPRLSEAARHLVIPEGIVTSTFPRVYRRLQLVGIQFDPWQEGFGSVALGCRKDGRYAAHFEHTIAITDDGPVLLTVAPAPAEEKLLLAKAANP